jgi:hypothetical protein
VGSPPNTAPGCHSTQFRIRGDNIILVTTGDGDEVAHQLAAGKIQATSSGSCACDFVATVESGRPLALSPWQSTPDSFEDLDQQ